ncbi:hypothetical protein K1719_011801 [Acacia pycnantha]|nr:hypothetical protein K1719_011801 [Acacia pycnantha]
MKILGLDSYADTLVGDEMLEGISGGQKMRLTTGELLVGPARVLFMDEISTGLDSSTTFQIIRYLKHSTRALDATTIVSLLQPAPETFELFDDVILLCEGQIVYQGPRESALEFFNLKGFIFPERKNVTSQRDQEQYWAMLDRPYRFMMERMTILPILSCTDYFQLLLVALITMSVFFRTTTHHNTIDDGGIYLGALYFSMAGCWVAVTYYAIGFDPAIDGFFQQFLLYFCLHQMSIALFRLIGSLGRNMIVANTFGSFSMLVVMALGGYVISRDRIPSWWIRGFWVSPLMHAQNSTSVNEFLRHSWDKRIGNHSSYPLGKALLRERSLYADSYWYWIGAGAMIGYRTILFNNDNNFLLFTFVLALGRKQALVSKEELQEREEGWKDKSVSIKLRDYLRQSRSTITFNQRGMLLPFQPLSLVFSNINYYVDVPFELKQQGILQDRLQLLANVTGAFRPGVLTTLVAVSGAGKTTLMDVLAGRKTGGIIEGDIYTSGYPKRQDNFARIAGYCVQTDEHSPSLTVLESLLFSSWLRLPSDVDFETQKSFVEEVMELVELTSLSGALVGLLLWS